MCFGRAVYDSDMPGKRHDSQTVTTLTLHKELLALVEKARLNLPGGVNRAEFIRSALAEKLMRLGVTVPDEITHAPDRARPLEEFLPKSKNKPKK